MVDWSRKNPKYLLKTPASKHWKKMGLHHHNGFVIPLFSLHSNQSAGIGEYPDLIPVIRWCGTIGYDTIQLLPLNDTGILTSPYSAITAFGLNPNHLGLAHLPNIDKHSELTPLLRKMQDHCSTMRVDYRMLTPLRQEFMRLYYNLEGKSFVKSAPFTRFVEENPWLKGYAVFKTLKQIQNWAPHQTWPDEIRKPSEELINKLYTEHRDEALYHMFIQYYCFEQMGSVKKEALKAGVHILGDIPILLGRESADIWQYHRLFKAQYNAGVPPDIFSKDGQNWELPIYDWDQMRKEHFDWWKMRLNTASHFFDIYRVDHILGLYRIWAIPYRLRGRKGLYLPHDPEDWIKQGEEIIQMMIDSSDMFPVGEDLGFIPEDIYNSLREMGIPGWKIIMWERDWNRDSSYLPLNSYPPANVVTLSTHDTLPLAAWWKHNNDDANAFSQFIGIPYKVPLTDESRMKILQAAHRTSCIFQINMLQEFLSLLPKYSFENPEDERVNMPNTVNKYNWSIRFIPKVEEFTTDKEFAQLVRQVIT